MRKDRRPLWVLLFCSALLVFACVTINIYFPAEKVESVAGDIVNDIRGPAGDKGKRPSGGDQSSILGKAFLAFSPAPAWAQEATSVSNPTIRALKRKMKARYAEMKPYYQKGMLREGSDGYVSVGDTKGLGLKARRDLKALVEAENGDRKTLYLEVAKALKIHPINQEQINKVARIFAKEWQKSVR